MSDKDFQKLRLWAIMVFTLLSPLIFFPRGESLAANAEKFHLSIGFSSRVFVNVPKADMKIAIQVLARKIAAKTVGSADARIYDSDSEIERDLRAKTLDMVALTPEQLIHLRDQAQLEPLMVTATGNSTDLELLLLVRRDSGVSRLAELRNRTIALPAEGSQFGAIYRTWLENLVMKEGARSAPTFLSTITETRGASQAVMSAFFRKSDACIVSNNAFEVLNELNPQLSRDLKVIASIDRLVGGIVAVRQDLPSERKQKVRHILKTLHEDPDGKQVLVLFQLSGIREFQPENMKATEAMLAENRTLKKRFAGRR
jgi:ABC-type phosphate/phosphonate transport system substrate-binding protein